ncbi:MAG: aryl-sulfate sulfotransferase [Chlorobi bacterium]|nr:aryl-sulfate sulfotransferase [Chlorobiota bacterium]MCI0716058.1 aryl-sulfate sulfotransferase [Chlorobiota bacterium]
MKKTLLLLIFVFALINGIYSGTYKKYFKYVEPVPGAKLVNKEVSIIIRPYEFINIESILKRGSVNVFGSLGGSYNLKVITSDDNKTIILQPLKMFGLGETVTVKFNSTIKTENGKNIKPFSYYFEIKTSEVSLPENFAFESEINFKEILKQPNGYYFNDMVSNFPNIYLNYYNGPSRGRIFMSNFAFSPQVPNTPHLIILNNDGQPFHSIQMPANCLDFNVQPNGNLTYYTFTHGGKYYELDSSSYAVVDSFYCGLGDSTDLHELRLLPNRHALLMSYDPQIVDMSQIVEGGYPFATVIGLIIQEIDANKNVVFRWRSWDHFRITDATHEDLLDTVIDYAHGNAIELDNDGNLLISSRHMDEITKINRTTGEIIWRLGGKNNQFTFINDPIKFSYQHAIRRISNGNITLFDNGNYHTPPFSRAVEYRLDEGNRRATLVWEYRNNPSVYGLAMGFVQRLDNGNTLISWGSTNPTVTEVRPNKSKVLEISLPPGVFTYRAFKYKWKEGSDGQIIPSGYYLNQNFPNPFNPSTSIKFGIPNLNSNNSSVHVKLKVYDIMGREVAILVDENLSPDSYRAEFNGSNLSSGIYFYKLIAGDFTESKKMVLVK